MSDNLEKVVATITELREEVKKSMPDPLKLKAMNEFLDKMEDQNQERVKEHNEVLKNALDLKERLEGLESEVARKSVNPKDISYKDSPEYKSLNAFCKGGIAGLHDLDEEIKSALRTDIDSQGGYLVPEELDSVILKKITEISPIRSIARVRTISGKTLNIPVRATRPSANYEGEAETGEESNSTYSNETLTPFRLTYTAPITMDMLMDSAFDMESEILTDAAEEFASKEGLKFVLGSGSKQPQGFLADPRVTDNFFLSATSGTVKATDIIKATGELKSGYNPMFVMNRRTLAILRQEQDSNGAYIWQPGINGIVMSTLAGDPYVIANDMPDIASLSLSIAYGDFLRGYTIVDRTGMSVIRDEFTAKKQAIVEFTMNRWNFGKVVLPEAIIGIQTKS